LRDVWILLNYFLFLVTRFLCVLDVLDCLDFLDFLDLRVLRVLDLRVLRVLDLRVLRLPPAEDCGFRMMGMFSHAHRFNFCPTEGSSEGIAV
jgi:hypothetical protein